MIGAGAFGAHHARTIASSAGLQLAAIVDVRPEVEQLADSLGARWFADWRQLPADITAVSVATPPHLNGILAAEMIAEGRHVFVEKPMALHHGGATAIRDMAVEQSRFVQVGMIERYNPAFLALAASVHEPISHIHAKRMGPERSWTSSVGVVLDLMIHDIDLVIHLKGQNPVEVRGQLDSRLRSETRNAICQISFADGSEATVTGRYTDHAVEREFVVEAGESRWSANFKDRGVDRLHEGRVEPIDLPSCDNPLKREFETFARGIRTGGPNPDLLTDTLSAHAVIDQFYEQADLL